MVREQPSWMWTKQRKKLMATHFRTVRNKVKGRVRLWDLWRWQWKKQFLIKSRKLRTFIHETASVYRRTFCIRSLDNLSSNNIKFLLRINKVILLDFIDIFPSLQTAATQTMKFRQSGRINIRFYHCSLICLLIFTEIWTMIYCTYDINLYSGFSSLNNLLNDIKLSLSCPGAGGK